jgi:uncharacterized lipoprotein YddW (UPF0748 family)
MEPPRLQKEGNGSWIVRGSFRPGMMPKTRFILFPPKELHTMNSRCFCLSAMLAILCIGVVACAPSGASSPPPASSPAPLPSAAAEHRALWLDLKDLDAERGEIQNNLRQYARANFNTLCIATQKRGYVLYDGGACLPLLPLLQKRPAVFPWIIEEAQSLGMKVEAWPEYGFMAYHTMNSSADSSRGVWLDSHPELVSLTQKGEAVVSRVFGDFYWLDSANPAAQDLVLDLWCEQIRRFPFDGINLDRVRFADAEHGFGAYSIKQFQADTGMNPASIAPGNEAWKRWRVWRKESLTRFMERASARMRSERPGIRISLAGVPPDMIDDVGQDWPTWLRKGYIDAVYPMLYETRSTRQLEAVRALLGEVHPRCYAGLSVEQGLAPIRNNISEWRAMGGKGVAIWYSTPALPLVEEFAREVFPIRLPSPLYEIEK